MTVIIMRRITHTTFSTLHDTVLTQHVVSGRDRTELGETNYGSWTQNQHFFMHMLFFKQKPQRFAFLCILCSIQNNYLKATVCVPERYVKVILKCTLVQALRLCIGRRYHRWSWDIAVLYRHWGTVQTAVPIGGVEVYLYSFLPTALEESEWSASRLSRSLPRGNNRYPL
jgi:hypothetical protein